MNTAHLSGSECSDYGAHESSSYPLWMKLSASVVVVSCAWCAYVAMGGPLP